MAKGTDQIERLIDQIDQAPDKLHGDYTPAVYQLIDIGRPALPDALGLMLSAEEPTRLRAQRVLEGITMGLYGFRPGRGWPHERDEEAWRSFWAGLGNLSYDAPAAARKESVRLWRQWLAQSKGE
jgi:hypothetical protein